MHGITMISIHLLPTFPQENPQSSVGKEEKN